MADKTHVVLKASGGDVTVGRRVPTYVYGGFDVKIPEGREQQEADSRVRAGYIYRPDNPPSGAFDVGFTRADVSLDMNARRSSLERVVDSAIKRTDGEVFFERDITPDGLGAWRPGYDFDVNDVVSVEIWGRRMALPVTALDYVRQDGEMFGFRPHVGGQLIRDAEQLQSRNDAVLERVERERQQLRRSIGLVSDTASSAQTRANTAQQKANAAQQKADQTALELAQINSRLIKELQAQTEAIKKSNQLSKSTSSNFDANSSAKIMSGVELRYLNRYRLQVKLMPSASQSGASIFIVFSAIALSSYTLSRSLEVSRDTPEQVIDISFFEAFERAAVLVFPHIEFQPLLNAERQRLGLQ